MQTIQEQAAERVQSGTSRFESRNNLSDLRQQQAEAENRGEAARKSQEVAQNIANYHSSGAKEQQTRGEAQKQRGAAMQTAGGVQVGLGGAMMAMGMALMFAGGAGAGLISKGAGLLGKGFGDILMGGAEIASGNTLIALALEKLELATAQEIIAKEEHKTLNKEMNRASILEQKIFALEAMTDTMRPMLEKLGVNSEDLTEEDMEKWFDKFFEDGALTLANGGILETNLTDINGNAMFSNEDGTPMEGNFYFMRNEEGEFLQVNPLYNENGDALTGALGEPLLDFENGTEVVSDPELREYLELQFSFVDMNEDIARGLGTTDFTDDGTASFANYDINNLDHMKEYAGLALATNREGIRSGRIAAPLKLNQDSEGNLVFQEWDWDNEVATGVAVPLDDITGGTLDRSDIEPYEIAFETSRTALQELGLGAGGNRFNILAGASSSVTGFASQAADGAGLGSFSARDGGAFADFLGAAGINTNVFEDPAAGNVLEGQA